MGAREAVVAAAAAVEDLAQGPGQGPAHGVPVGLALAPGPAQSLATGPEGLHAASRRSELHEHPSEPERRRSCRVWESRRHGVRSGQAGWCRAWREKDQDL